jgi:hypothetical protein
VLIGIQLLRCVVLSVSSKKNANDNQELMWLVYAHMLGVAKLNHIAKLPWYPSDNNKATWPLVLGTTEPVLRFRWDESRNHNNIFYSI